MSATAPNTVQSASARPRWRWRPTLSFTLLSLVLALLIVTVGAVAIVGRISQRRAIEDLEGRLARAASGLLGFAISDDLQPGPPLLLEAQDLALRGRLDVENDAALDDFLVERLRYQPGLDRFGYSDQATGRFRGAWRRDDGAIILNTSDPRIDGGRAVEVEVTRDGRRLPSERESVAGYDPRQREWYTRALSRDGVIWAEPYVLNVGSAGVTVALALRQPTGAVRGVFTADFFLDKLSQRLAREGQGRLRARDWHFAVISRGGRIVASASASDQGQPAGVVEAARTAMPPDLNLLLPERPLSLTFDVDGVPYHGQAQALPLTTGLEMIVVAAVPEHQVLEVVYESQRLALAIGLTLLLLSIIVGAYVSRRIARPLRLIAADLERVGQFEISNDPSPRSFVHETEVVGDAVDRMKASLRSFARYVPRQLVHDVLASGQEARLGGRVERLSLYFSDIEGFTRVSEEMAPGDLVEHLGEYLEAMTLVIEGQQGTVDKFIGDGILALFGAPRAVPEHAAEACRAALQSQARLRQLAAAWEARGKPILRARIGLHTGEVIVGNIGTPERFEFTVTGDAVNLASRLEGLNKVYGTSVMGSQEVRDAAGPGFEWRTLDRVAVVGRAGGTLVGELLGERGAVDPNVLRARELYEAALRAYFALDLARAADGFRAAARARPDDRAARIMVDRAELFMQNPPPAGWDGVYHATTK